MRNFNAYIDQKLWGQFSSDKSKKGFQEEMQEALKALHPLNMSEKGVAEYRKRFENSTVYVYESGEKATHLNKHN